MPTAELNRTALSRVVSVINGKGGVGKTTLTVNIGGVLAASGWRVLIIDMDPQGNIGIDAGYRGTDRDDKGKQLAAALTFGFDLKPLTGIRENLDIIPGGDYLNQAQQALSNAELTDPRLSLATALAPIAGEYDIILIDCPPGNRSLQIAAAAASRFLFIPTKADEASRLGLTITAQLVTEINDINPGVELLGVVLFGSSKAAVKVRKDFTAEIAATLGVEPDDEVLFRSFIRHADSTGYAVRKQGLLAFELESKVDRGPKWYESLRSGEKAASAGPRSATSVADDMQNVVDEFLGRFNELTGE